MAPTPATLLPSHYSLFSLILINDSSPPLPFPLLLLQLHHLLPINSPTTTSIMNHLNRKLLQQQQDPFHPILPPTLLHPINDSPPSSSTTAAAVNNRPFNPTTTPFDTSMALTILVLLTALFFMTFFSFYIRRFSGAADIDPSNSHHRRGSNSSPSSTTTAVTHRGSRAVSKGLDPELIKSLPTFPYGWDAKYRIDCSICLSEFEEGETVKLIDYCRHGFHPGCIDTWLASHVSCPLCRSTQLFSGGGVGLGTVEDNVSRVPARSLTADDSGGGGGGGGDDVVVGTGILRRTCSYSSLVGGGGDGDCLSLPRSNSF